MSLGADAECCREGFGNKEPAFCFVFYWGKPLVPSHSLEGTQRCFLVCSSCKVETVPHLPALMQLGSVKDVLKSFLGKELPLVLISGLPVGGL